MEDAKFYFRFQKSGENFFLQAPCVMMSYLLQKRAETNANLSGFPHWMSPNLFVTPFQINNYTEEIPKTFWKQSDDAGARVTLNALCVEARKLFVQVMTHLYYKVVWRNMVQSLFLIFAFQNTYFRMQQSWSNKDNEIGVVHFDGVNDKGKFIPLEQTGGDQVEKQDKQWVQSIIASYGGDPLAKLFEASRTPKSKKLSARKVLRGKAHVMTMKGMQWFCSEGELMRNIPTRRTYCSRIGSPVCLSWRFQTITSTHM